MTIAKKENQTITIVSPELEKAYSAEGWGILKIETEFKNKKEQEDEWIAKFGD